VGNSRTGNGLLAAAVLCGALGFGCAHRHGSMMEERMQAMEERQQKLDGLVDAMNAARGAEKVDAIAAVVNELVSQHKAMHEGMRGKPGR
jgi:polyhydroxyalkanoate synthesis regulator protein